MAKNAHLKIKKRESGEFKPLTQKNASVIIYYEIKKYQGGHYD